VLCVCSNVPVYCIRSQNLNGSLVYHMYVILLDLICCFTGFSMQDIKTSLSVAPVLSTPWFGAWTGLMIEINCLFPDALWSFHFLTSGCLYTTYVHSENWPKIYIFGCRAHFMAPLAITVLYIIFRDFKNIKVHIKI
jgi:photosystem I subunit IX